MLVRIVSARTQRRIALEAHEVTPDITRADLERFLLRRAAPR
jgi:hypothetical protein